MSVYFSEKFKQLRKAHDLTQDQIADIFHVSPQSVSRWETGANYPDIETLPHIAGFFKVTVDELLGTELIRGERKAAEYKKEIRNLLNSGRLYDAIDTARKAVKEYPVNYDLQGHLMQALCTACSGPKADENTGKYKEEIITIGQRVINYCTDLDKSLWVKWQLIRQYVKWGMKEEAKIIVYTLPHEAYFTQDLALGYVLEGEEWVKNQKNRIVRFTIMLCGLIYAYADKAGLEPLQKIDCLKAAMQIEEMAYSISGEQIDTVNRAEELTIRIAELYCEADDIENALDYAEQAARDAMRHVEQMYKTNEDGSNYYAWPTPRNLCWILWEDHLMKPQFDMIRNDERFIKYFELLKNNSRELK